MRGQRLYLLVAAVGARWTMFVAGLLPTLAGLGGLVLYARSRLRREVPTAAATELA